MGLSMMYCLVENPERLHPIDDASSDASYQFRPESWRNLAGLLA